MNNYYPLIIIKLPLKKILLPAMPQIIVLAIFLLSIEVTHAQLPVKELIEQQFNNYREHHLQEKIFVHTDKSIYQPGEICWFKIYNVDAYFHQPMQLGKLVYVEISADNNTPVLQAKIGLENGAGDGSLLLPATLISGNYHLRAYTNWMKNYGADYFFEKQLVIINPQKNIPVNIGSSINRYNIGIFPEGGNLVTGIESKVGCKVVNQQGKGVNFEGTILNEKGDTITRFYPLHAGIGSFTFTPQAGVAYRAEIKVPGEPLQVKQLPEAYNTGYAMHLQNNGQGQIKVTVQSPDKNSPSYTPVFLFIHCRNIIISAISTSLKNGLAEFVLDEKKLGEGISHFTLFNEQRQPVCERLFFKKPLKVLQITATPNQEVYTLRKKINIGIATTNEAGNFTDANMSMAVYKIDSLTNMDGLDINSYLYLCADLPGNIETPEYYFTQTNNATAAIDNLMLTQGWRRFKWEDILLNKKPAFEFQPEINGHIINGKITATVPGLTVKDTKAYLSAPGTYTQFNVATADINGNVKFEMKKFYTNGSIIAQTDNELNKGYKVDIFSPFFQGYAQKSVPAFDNQWQNKALLPAYISTQVQTAFLKDKLQHFLMPPLDTTAFYLKPDALYLLDNYVRFSTLEEVLREYVKEIMVRKNNGNFLLPLILSDNINFMTTRPLVLLDAVPVFDFNKLMKYDPLKIRKLEVQTKTYYLGKDAFDGIANYTTYKGDLDGYELNTLTTVLDYEGLQLQREFYAPVYETTTEFNSRLPDFRSLLYWAPRLVTNKKGELTTDFYTSDIAGRYAIVIEGLSNDGRAGSKVSYFEVKK